MDCPYCGKEMKVGTIPSGSRWMDKSTMDTWEGVPLCGGFESGPTAFFCSDCRQIVIPVPEIEGVWNKVQRKIDAVSEKLGAIQEKGKEQRTQAAQKKAREEKKKLGQKDPWEL